METTIKKRSIKIEILGILLLVLFLVTTTLGYLLFHFSKNRLISMLGDSNKAIAATAATFIYGEDLLRIRGDIEGIRQRHLASTSLIFSEIYEKMGEAEKVESETLNSAIKKYADYMSLLTNVKNLNKIESPINIYMQDKNRLKLMISSDRALLLGAVYLMRPEAEKVLLTNLPQATGVYKDKDGTWISAFAAIPLPHSAGERAIIEITNKIDSYMNRLREELVAIILICLIGFFATAILGYQLVNKLAVHIKKLDDVAGELEKENYEIKIDIKSEDEIGHLAETFDKLRISIKNKIAELKLALNKEKSAHLESIIALTNAIELRDPYTRQHLYRVDKYALLIAKEVGLSQHELERLRASCYLHDVGKIYIEDALLKKTPLSDSEFKEIKKHSVDGAKIIEGIPFFKETKDVILHHQERYDGTGYPNGLKGKAIPLLARIVAVADAFDAMTTDRPYRKKIGYKEAMDIIEKNAGTQFDPEICAVFLKYRNSIEDIAKKHF